MKFRAGVFFILLLLPSCGFSPIYGDHGAGKPAVAVQLSGVLIENIDGQQGQFLRNKLMDRLYYKGRPAQPTAYLEISIHSYEVDLGIQKDATATRRQMNVSARYALRDPDKKTLLSGTAQSVASYGKLAAQYGTLATQRGAQERALTEISEQITSRLSLYYAENDAVSANKTKP